MPNKSNKLVLHIYLLIIHILYLPLGQDIYLYTEHILKARLLLLLLLLGTTS